MFSFLGRLFGTKEAVTEGVHALRDGLDVLYYTEEEKATDKAAAISEARSMLVRWMEATQGQNIARRLIALVVTSVWLLQYALSMIGDMIYPWLSDPDFSARFAVSSKAIAERADGMNGAMMLILGFYFAAPHMSEIIGAAIGKFSKPLPKG